MNKNKFILFTILGAIVLLIIIFVFGYLINRKTDENSIYNTKAELNIWVISDNKSSHKTAILKFNEKYPNISFKFRNFEGLEEYEETLIDALAAGQGPDIFVIQNSDILRKANKIFPVPESQYSIRNLRNDFPEIVEEDFYLNNKIYALPNSIDTLAMIYNKDIFNENALVYPADNWEEFKTQVVSLTDFDEDGDIKFSGAAIGGSEKIKHFENLVTLLMFQSGSKMISSDFDSAIFNNRESQEILDFYTQFSNKNSDSYVWDNYLPQDFEAFAREKTGIVFAFSSDIEDIENRNLFLKLGIAPVPQIKEKREVAIANYFGYTVSRQTRYPTIAWDFIKYLTLDGESVKDYLDETNKPPALKYYIEEYKNDEKLGVFAKQALIAMSWKKPDSKLVNNIFKKMIKVINFEGQKVRDSLQSAENEVSNLLKNL